MLLQVLSLEQEFDLVHIQRDNFKSNMLKTRSNVITL